MDNGYALTQVCGRRWSGEKETPSLRIQGGDAANRTAWPWQVVYLLIADIYISISTGTFDIENIKYEKKWQQLDLDTNFEP